MPDTTKPKGWSGTVTIVVMREDKDQAIQAIKDSLRKGGLSVQIVSKLELKPVYRVN